MNFTRTTSYSLNVLRFMAQNEELRMSAAYLHDQLGIPYSYLRTILSRLSKNRLIDSTRGRNGGFCLSRDKSAIYIAEIIEATEGSGSLSKCIMGFDSCPLNYGCSMHPLWIKMRNDFLSLLQGTSLEDLIMASNKPDNNG